MGLDVMLYHRTGGEHEDKYEPGVMVPNEESVEIPSAAYPEHLFKVGYWRSSYNSGGINHILQDRIGKDLYWIAGVDGEAYEVTPDWSKVIERARQAKAELEAWLETNGRYGVMDIRSEPLRPDITNVKSSAEALDVFLETQRTHAGSEGWWANHVGEFFMDHRPAIAAAIAGSAFGRSSVYLIYEQEADHYDYYLQSLDVVVETAEYVLAQPDPETYVLYWSG